MPRQGKYPDEVRERAVRMVLDHEHEYGSQWEAICSVAEKLGPKAETVRLWVRRTEADEGRRPGPTSEQLAELKRLKRENAELCRANDILKAAASFFGAELDCQSKKWSGSSRPIGSVVARGCVGESSRSAECCRSRRPPTTRRSGGRRRPAGYGTLSCAPRSCGSGEDNLFVYGADKVWDQLNKDGIRVARCTVERRDMGLQGCRRGRTRVRTTQGDERLERAADLVERHFRAPAPHAGWCTWRSSSTSSPA